MEMEIAYISLPVVFALLFTQLTYTQRKPEKEFSGSYVWVPARFFVLLFNSRLTQALYLCFRVFFSRICCTVFRVSLLFFYVSDSWLVVLVRKSFRFQFQLFYSFDLLISWLPFVLLSSTISHNHSLCVCVCVFNSCCSIRFLQKCSMAFCCCTVVESNAWAHRIHYLLYPIVVKACIKYVIFIYKTGAQYTGK